MEHKSHALTAGLFTIALTLAAILIALWLNRDNEERVPYQLATKLSVPGLNPQATVRYRGLDVGRVDEIKFDPKVPGQILINISVQSETPITQSTFATLGYQGVTGIAYVDLNDDGSKPTPVRSSPQQIARIELRPSLLDNLQSKGLAILEKTEELTARVNTLLSPDNQQAVLDAFHNVSAAAEELQTIPQQLQPVLAKLPALTEQAQSSMASISRLSQNIDGLATELRQPNGAMDRLADAADRVGSVADRIELEALPLAQDARTSLRTIDRTLENLNERPSGILFGASQRTPGPGEDGFVAPE
jgi:phospholipid/cholesterol/gamma-HCH transport system substrate-binding protein